MRTVSGDENLRLVLAQTMQAFDFLIIDDGSTDDSLSIIRSFDDPRIRVVVGQANRGVAERLNEGMALARAPLVARMDADDIAAPDRLERQLVYMRTHPTFAISGTGYVAFNEAGDSWKSKLPKTDAGIGAKLLFGSPFGHPTVIMNRQVLQNEGLRYDPSQLHVEDYDLWERAHGKVRMANVPDVLLRYRLHPKQVSAAHEDVQICAANRIRERALRRRGIRFSDVELMRHCRIANIWLEQGFDVEASRSWLRKLTRSAWIVTQNGRALRHECAYWRKAIRNLERRRTIARQQSLVQSAD